MTKEKKDFIKMCFVSLMCLIGDVAVIAGLIYMLVHSISPALIVFGTLVPVLVLSVFHYASIQYWKYFFKQRKENKEKQA